MTQRECAIIMAFTGSCMLTGENLKSFYDYVEELMGRPVYSHEISELSEEIKERSRGDFIDLCRSATDGKNAEAVVSNKTKRCLPGLKEKMAFDDEYFKPSRLFCMDTYEVKMPMTKDGEYVQVRKKSRVPIMVVEVCNYGNTLRFYDMFERCEREISAGMYYHGYNSFVEACVIADDEEAFYHGE